MKRCIVCNQKDPKYPNIDYNTGFTFCSDCWQHALEMKDQADVKRLFTDDLSCWLGAIAAARQYHMAGITA